MTVGRRAAAMALGVALVLGQVSGPADANHGGRPIGSFSTCDRPVTPRRCSSVGDDRVHRVHFDATLTEGLRSSLRDTMAEDYGATRLEMIVDEEITPETDVIAFSEDYGENGAAGWVACPPDVPQGINRVGHRWCRGQELFLNLNPRYSIFFDDDASRDHVTCHELGHTLGLRHWGNPPESSDPYGETCMNANTPNGPTVLHRTDVDHINAYPYLVWGAPRGRFFQLLFLSAGTLAGADEVESAGSLDEMSASADAVVRATITSVEPGRVFGGATGHPLHYASVTVSVAEVLAGSLGPREVTLEVPLFDGPESISQLRAADSLEAIFFLRAKTDGDFYRLTNFGAVIANDDGMAATTDGPESLQALAGLPFSEAIRRVQAAGD